MQLIFFVSQALSNRWHVKHFDSHAAYDDYYDLAVDIGDIGVEQFATKVQSMLVHYLRAQYCDGPADWCERFWTGARGRYCLVHSRYAGCNNNMGVEVGWREIKKICDVLAKLGAFIGALCHFISSALGSESMARLKLDSGDRNAFIRIPRPLKFMWDQVQSVHRLFLSCCHSCVILESTKHNAQPSSRT